MKIFFCGDFESQTGPAIANKNMKKGLENIETKEDRFYFSRRKNRGTRVLELINIIGCDFVVLCSASKINKYAIRIAKIFGAKIIYIMHGLESLECKINAKGADRIREARNYESYIFENVDKIVAVSKKFADVLKQEYPMYIDKFDYYFNSIPKVLAANDKINTQRDNKRKLISIGGCLPQKCMIPICQAVEQINESSKRKIEFVIIGKDQTQIEEIKSYPFVTYIEEVNHDELMRILSKGGFYIQNSLFETFGLSIIEALSVGCNILMSCNVGVIDLFDHLRPDDVIEDNFNVQEITEKITRIFEHENYEYLYQHFNWEKVECKNTAKDLLRIIDDIQCK